MDLVDVIESKRFLGGEFLVWLWYRVDVNDGRFELSDLGPIEVGFEDQLVLQAFLAETEQSRLSGGAPTQSPEARIALRAGKRITKAKMRINREEREWVFTVAASDFVFSSVKLPAVLKGDDDERILERLTLIDELADLWRGLYRLFLQERLGDDWESVREGLLSWAQEEA